MIYTYDEAGTGRLYLNGNFVQSVDNVPYEVCTETPFVIGGGRWIWDDIKSLDGSVQHMVLFDRALDGDEVASLYQATRPEKEPSPQEDLVEAPTPSLDDLITILRNGELADADRAEAALALAGMGQEAVEAVADLRAVLESITERDGAHLPKVEDLLRNAVMRALLDIAPEDEPVRALLGETLAMPFFGVIDLSNPHLEKVRALGQEGHHMDALEAHRDHLKTIPKLPRLSRWGANHTDEHLDALRGSLPLRGEYLDAYFSKGFPFSDAHYNAYSQLDIVDGTTYIPVVERVSFEEVQRVFEETLKDLTDEEPDPEAKWSRLKILEIAPDGSEREVLLGGPWLIYDARDGKYDGWGILVDQEGYIHLTGGQHNGPNRNNWVPGSWEKLGIASGEQESAEVMYWVSEEPYKIESFEFVGQRGNPRSFGSGIRGVSFDRTGRMHVQMPIFGVGREGRVTQGPIYAYSDDLGETFHRADGTPLRLPLTVNPIPGHDAHIEHHSSKQWFDVWMSLIQEAGWNRAGGFDR